MEFVTLQGRDGTFAMPAVGFGTWKAASGQVDNGIAQEAIRAGYRHFDSAEYYGTEEAVGRAIRESGVPRGDFTVTSKVWKTHMGRQATLDAFERSLSRFGFDYLDLYFVHWPRYAEEAEDWQDVLLDTWGALEELHDAGQVRALAVSNFKPHHLELLLEHGRVAPVLNQVEFHPGFLQQETRAFCGENGIAVQAWRPLAQGGLAGNEAMSGIAAAHGVSVGQVALRFDWQSGVSVVPKSTSPERMRQNLDIFDFELNEDEMEAIRSIPEGTAWSGLDPDGEWPAGLVQLKVD